MTTRNMWWEGSAYMQDIVSHIREALPELEKVCDMMFPVTLYQKNINTHYDATGFDVLLQSPSGAVAHCSQQTVDI
jgi:hypothetical protein